MTDQEAALLHEMEALLREANSRLWPEDLPDLLECQADTYLDPLRQWCQRSALAVRRATAVRRGTGYDARNPCGACAVGREIQAVDANVELRARVEVLEAALRPFAASAALYSQALTAEHDERPARPVIRLEYLRRAREVLADD